VSSALTPTIRTAIPVTAKVDLSAASTILGASRAPSLTAPSPSLLDSFQGKKLNAPNDVVVAADGAIWFTDPGYGIFGNYEGRLAEPELPPRVYRLDAKTGQATVVADDFDKPNGLAFSSDEKKLYIGLTHGGRSNMRVFDVSGDKLANGKVFAENFAAGFTDGVRTNTDGNVWCSMGWADPKEDGVRRYAPSGHRKDSSAGDLRQSVLRRQEAEPVVHGGQHLGLRDLCRDPRCLKTLMG
jgi:sugar lactone lactonase YvrE